MNQRDVEMIADSILAKRGVELSKIALDGYADAGRGAILLRAMTVPHASNAEADISVRMVGYQSLEQLKKARLERTFYALLEGYDPKVQGVVSFVLEPGGGSGYFWFGLDPAAVLRV